MHQPLKKPEAFPIGMPAWVEVIFYVFVAFVAGLTTWFFRGGMYSAGAVMCIVFVPLIAAVYYALHIMPRRSMVIVGEEGVVLSAKPFVDRTLFAAEVVKAFRADLKADERLAPKDKKVRKGLHFGPFQAGEYELVNGHTAVVLTRRADVLALFDGSTYFLLGPADLDGLAAALDANGLSAS